MEKTTGKTDSQPLGAGWVAGQFVLFALVATAAFFGPSWPWQPKMRIAGTVVAAFAVALFAAGIVALGSALTPFPRPRGQLVERGPFALVRHPIYGGVLLGLLGVSLISRPLALLPTFASAVFLTLKARHEERLLREAVAGYDDYCERVRRRFVPFVF
jgi:protein-S-isoprenylcysteine O-methyltransferase Ste14